MKTLKQKHQKLIELVPEPEVKRRLHNWYDRNIRKAKRENQGDAKFEGDVGQRRLRTQVSQIIDHLNSITGMSYRTSSKETRSLIKSRLNEGFTVEDFKKVNEIKTRKWLNNDNRIYLRPITLYRASKFEGYIQEYNLREIEKGRKQKEKRKREKEEQRPNPEAVKKISSIIGSLSKKLRKNNTFHCSPSVL